MHICRAGGGLPGGGCPLNGVGFSDKSAVGGKRPGKSLETGWLKQLITGMTGSASWTEMLF